MSPHFDHILVLQDGEEVRVLSHELVDDVFAHDYNRVLLIATHHVLLVHETALLVLPLLSQLILQTRSQLLAKFKLRLQLHSQLLLGHELCALRCEKFAD